MHDSFSNVVQKPDLKPHTTIYIPRIAMVRIANVTHGDDGAGSKSSAYQRHAQHEVWTCWSIHSQTIEMIASEAYQLNGTVGLQLMCVTIPPPTTVCVYVM